MPNTDSPQGLSKGRLLGLGLLAFTVLASYEAARSPVESLFLSAHGPDALPTAWMFVALGAVATVALYARLASRFALMPLMAGASVVSMLLLGGLLWARDRQIPGYAYAFYVWKDIYIVVLIETFWSYANSTLDLKAARWLYGALCTIGSLGSLAGGYLVGLLAGSSGSTAALTLTLPILGVTALIALAMHRFAPTPKAQPDASTPQSFSEGLGVLKRSDYLVLMLLLILTIQLIITFVDYRFNGLINDAYPDENTRTWVISRVYMAVSAGALVLQLSTGFILALGFGRVFVGLPVVVGLTVLGLAIHPVFLLAAAAKITGKAFDYSLFRATKEMLYIPLSYAERTQGKAVVDMLTYRVAKGGVALALHGLVAAGLAFTVGWITLGLVAVWGALAVLIIRRWRGRTAGDTGNTEA